MDNKRKSIELGPGYIMFDDDKIHNKECLSNVKINMGSIFFKFNNNEREHGYHEVVFSLETVRLLKEDLKDLLSNRLTKKIIYDLNLKTRDEILLHST